MESSVEYITTFKMFYHRFGSLFARVRILKRIYQRSCGEVGSRGVLAVPYVSATVDKCHTSMSGLICSPVVVSEGVE